MNRIHLCLTDNRARRAAVRLLQAAALTLIFAMAIPARAAGEREVRTRVSPVYPEIAKRMKISGAVKVEVTVDSEGKVTQAKAISGNQMLSPAAEDAVRRWKFESGDGSSTMQVVIDFNL
jgi:TonB family protein